MPIYWKNQCIKSKLDIFFPKVLYLQLIKSCFSNLLIERLGRYNSQHSLDHLHLPIQRIYNCEAFIQWWQNSANKKNKIIYSKLDEHQMLANGHGAIFVSN